MQQANKIFQQPKLFIDQLICLSTSKWTVICSSMLPSLGSEYNSQAIWCRDSCNFFVILFHSLHTLNFRPPTQLSTTEEHRKAFHLQIVPNYSEPSVKNVVE